MSYIQQNQSRSQSVKSKPGIFSGFDSKPPMQKQGKHYTSQFSDKSPQFRNTEQNFSKSTTRNFEEDIRPGSQLPHQMYRSQQPGSIQQNQHFQSFSQIDNQYHGQNNQVVRSSKQPIFQQEGVKRGGNTSYSHEHNTQLSRQHTDSIHNQSNQMGVGTGAGTGNKSNYQPYSSQNQEQMIAEQLMEDQTEVRQTSKLNHEYEQGNLETAGFGDQQNEYQERMGYSVKPKSRIYTEEAHKKFDYEGTFDRDLSHANHFKIYQQTDFEESRKSREGLEDSQYAACTLI